MEAMPVHHGSIFDIMHYSTRDGPGIRTTVFLKGCPLGCLWCHNPESQARKPVVLYRQNLCIGCWECLEACPPGAIRLQDGQPVVDSDLCNLCGLCAEACTAEARVLVGREASVAEVMAEIEKDTIFFDESGGGVTFSGGEALMQRDFLLALLMACKEKGIHTGLDTSGFAPWPVLESVLPFVDLFLYDLKAVDDSIHQKFTGVSNRLILENLARLSALGRRILVRVPLIPGVNDGAEAIAALGRLAAGLPHLEGVELLAYHEAGVEKYRRLGREYLLAGLQPASEERIEAIARTLRGYSLSVQVGG
jgi:pyruvate formate lyase activating enzyme